ncbi:MAG: GNAT family N-acetyltransferase [Gemmataceae bacterium]|nr:GNAT family N-acetyltransferase [Gemmataceae bacterium]
MSVSTGRARRDRVRLHIRWMIRRDLPDVLLAERAGFDHPWTEDDFLRCLRQRNCIGMVAEMDDPPGFPPPTHGWGQGGARAVGYMIYELHKTRLHVLNFAVHPAARRTGIGGQMVGKLIHKLTTHRRLKITLAVRERNLLAQTFFRGHDFRATRVLRNYYEDSGEDAFQMEYRAGDLFADEPVGRVNRIAQYEEN